MRSVKSHGRELPLAELHGAFDEAQAGRGRAVLVTGEPGIGKTLLVEDATRHARRQGLRVVVARCPSGAGAPPYWPWSEALAACAGADTGRRLLSGERLGDHRLPSGPEDDSARFELFSRATRAFHDAACENPLVVVLDDLHWADTPTLRLFEFLAGNLHSTPLLLVGAYRDVDIGPEHPLSALAGRLPGDTTRLELRPLGAGPLARLMAETIGVEPAPELVRRVHRHTGGNPLFTKEVVRLLASEGRLAEPPGRLALPAGVRGVIERRLAGVAPAEVDVLRWGALSGDEFDTGLVEQASGTPHGDVQRALATARRNRLAEPLPERPGWFRYTHGLVAETLREGLVDGDRRSRHLRLGRTLIEASPGPGAPGVPVAAISRHLLAALPEGDDETAADHTVRAARQAAHALAWEEAVVLYDRALQVLDSAVAARSDPRVAELRIERAAVVARAGDGSESRRAAIAAVDAARSSGDPELLARAALTYSARTFADAGDDATIDLLEEALAGLPAEDRPVRAELLARTAEELSHLDRPRSARMAEEARALATRLGDPVAVWEALIQVHRVQRGGVDIDERLATSTELVRLGRRLEDSERTLLGRIRRVVDLMAAGRRSDVDQELAAFARSVDRARLPSFRWFVPLWMGTRAVAEGRLVEAQGHADEVGRLAAVRGEYALAQFVIQLAGIRLHQGALHDVEGFFALAAHRYPTIPVYRCALAFVHTELGRPASAQALLEPLAADGFATVPEDQEWTTAAYCLAEACVALQRADWAPALAAKLLPHARQQVVNSSGALHLGSVAHSLGRLAALAGRPDTAEEHFHAALAASRHFGAPLWAAQVQHDWAALLLARGRPADGERAHELLDEAGTFADEMDIPRLRRQVADTRAGTDAAAVPVVAAVVAPANVFRREGELWTVAYQGTSASVRDRKGMHDIAALLAAPGRGVHVLELLAARGEPRLDRGADPGLDATAVAGYRRRLADLEDELDEAQRFADTGRADRARDELEAITSHLSAALGLGRRPRQPGDPVERARKTVWRRMRTSIDSIGSQHAALARHLERSLNTGTFCSYNPEEPVDWSLS